MSANNFTKHYKFIKVLNTTSLQITKLLKFPFVNIIKKCIQKSHFLFGFRRTDLSFPIK